MKLCLFSSYYEGDVIPNYVKFWLESLIKFNDEVILITNDRTIIDSDIEFLNKVGIKLLKVSNEGFDFGMWYKALVNININDYVSLSLVNDSCVLFGELDDYCRWSDNTIFEYSSMMDSNELGYHLQSFILHIKGKAMKLVYDYFMKHGVINTSEVRDIINTYEIGLSKHLVSNGIKIGSFVRCTDHMKEPLNVMILKSKELLSKMPVIKKKVLFQDYRDHEIGYLKHHGFDIDTNYKLLIHNIVYKLNNNVNINYLMDMKIKMIK